MKPNRSRRQSAGSGLARALGLLLLALLFTGSALLLTCRRNVPRSYHQPMERPRDAEKAAETPPAEKSSPPQPIPSGKPAQTAAEPEPVAESPSEPTPGPTRGQPAPSAPETRPPRPAPPGFREVSRGAADSPKIALTFDAGADWAPTPDILDALARHGVRATFFLTGKWVEKQPELTRRIADEGHEIANHTYSHRRLTTLSASEIVSEVEKTDQLVLQITGRSTKPLVRVPYGSRDRRVLSILAGEGYRSIFWDVDSWDGFKRGITSGEIRQRVLGKVGNGSIVLMHCGSRATADALDSILQQLLGRGYRPVTVSELVMRNG